MASKLFIKFYNIKFNQNQFMHSQDVPKIWTDGLILTVALHG
jgi:hypothetical protein